MRVLAEVTIETGEDDNGNPTYERGQWWLLHFGLEFKMIETESGLVPVNYTVAVCENYETGQVETFMPGQLKILGTKQ